MERETYELPKEIAVAEVDIKIREIGEDVGDVLLKVGKRVGGISLMIGGAGVIYNATKQEDQTTAIAEGILGSVLEAIGIYLSFSLNSHGACKYSKK